MSNSLSAYSPANSYPRLLQIGDSVLDATGFFVRLGDGTATPLKITNAGIAVSGSISAATVTLTGGISAGSVTASGNIAAYGNITSPTFLIGSAPALTTLNSNATTPRTVAMADASGSLYPAQCLVLVNTLQTATASIVASTVTDLAFTPEAGALYDFEAMLMVQTLNTTVGPAFKFSGPTMTLMQAQATLYGADGSVMYYGALSGLNSGTPGSLITPTGLTAINTTYLLRIKGFYKVGGSTAALNLTMQADQAVTSAYISLIAGSLITHTRRG